MSNVEEYLALRAIANGEVEAPPGESGEDRLARLERIGELHRILKADGQLPRLTTKVRGFGSRRRLVGPIGSRVTGLS